MKIYWHLMLVVSAVLYIDPSAGQTPAPSAASLIT